MTSVMYWGHGSYQVVQGGVALTLMARLIKANFVWPHKIKAITITHEILWVFMGRLYCRKSD